MGIITSLRGLGGSMNVFAYLRALITDDDGCVATEYVFLIAFLCIAVAFAAVLYGQALLNFFNTVAGGISGAAQQLPPGAPSTPTN